MDPDTKKNNQTNQPGLFNLKPQGNANHRRVLTEGPYN